MKVIKLLAVFILTMVVSTVSLHAIENLSVEPAFSAADHSAKDNFLAVVTGDGKLVLKPGPLFTDGGHHEGMKLPYLLSQPKPILYPRWALRQGWQGEVSIAIEILVNGRVGRSKVMKSTGHKMLDEAAVKAVSAWKFYPAAKDGKFVVTCIQIPVRFQID